MPSARARNRSSHLVAFAAYVMLAIAVTWPLTAHLSAVVAHDVGDPLAFAWVLWWNAEHLPLTSQWLGAPLFFPSEGAIVYQDSLLGVWPLSTLLQWAGVAPVAVLNLLVIASFALSAFTGWLLCLRLTEDRAAALAGGLAFGFAPYRAAQLAHVNVLLVFWVPLMLLGLHQYLVRYRRRWLAFAAGCWAMQGLTSGYFLLYTTPLIGLWALFFLRARLRAWTDLGVFWLAAFALLWPWLSAYRAVHARYGFDRGINEVAALGADIGGLLKASPLLTAWGTWLADTTREEQLFPGLTLACAVVVTVATSRYWRPPVLTRVTGILMCAAAAFLTAAAVAYFAPIDFRVVGVKIGLTRPHKPLGVAWLLLGAALLSTRQVRRAAADRSVPAFYALTAVALTVLSLGPAPRFFGARVWYRAPYAWLMSLPGFDAVRVPARFWLLTTLCLSVVLAFGLTRLRALGTRSYHLVVGVICVGLLVDGWFRLPLLPLPARIHALETSVSREPVLELPLGRIESETAAMYRATYHRVSLVNGYSAHFPAAYLMLRSALRHGDAQAIAPFAEISALTLVVDTYDRDATRWAGLAESAGAALQDSSGRFRIFRLPKRDATHESAPSPLVAIAAAVTDTGLDVRSRLTDASAETYVYERAADATSVRAIDIKLECRALIDEIEIAAASVPPVVEVLAPRPGRDDQRVWSGPTGEPAVRAALLSPSLPRLRLRFAPAVAERVHLRLAPSARGEAWLISGLVVRGGGCQAAETGPGGIRFVPRCRAVGRGTG